MSSEVKLTPELRTAIDMAVDAAVHRRQEFAGTEHLFLALLYDALSARALRRSGADVEGLKVEVEKFVDEQIPRVPEKVKHEVSLSLGFEQAMYWAQINAATSERGEVSGPHVLIALFNLRDCHSVYLMQREGVTKLDLMDFASHHLDDDDEEDGDLASPDGEGDDDASEGGPRKKKGTPLEEFCTNLNLEAEAGRIDQVIGRKKEIDRAIHVLCRRRKNNPVLVGDAGVGKTAVVEGLALAIQSGQAPEPLKNAIIWSLDVGTLVAGTRYRGDFEERVKSIIKALEKQPDAILFIDEIHTLVGAGSASGGSLDASSILKPALGRGRIRCIGVTTFKEYRGIFERDHALARRFQKIDISEPSTAETALILNGLRKQYEDFHGVTITGEAIEAAADLASKHLNDRRQPDKAIDLIDEASAAVRLSGGQIVTDEIIEQTLSRMANIPPKRVQQSDRERIALLEPELKKVIFGQDEAVSQLISVIKLSRAGIGNPDKPIGSFLFSGPTGVGKTEVARQLARIMGVELLRFDMSEYMEPHSVSRLIGAPPGYVGFDQGGLLTEAVAKNPHAVLLLDEIEKAHREIFNVLLQVMDHGSLTDHNGKKADFRNVILIMTSNVGARELQQRRPGFHDTGKSASAVMGDEEKAYKDAFSPEFRNRLDARVQFRSLAPEVMISIVDKFLTTLAEQLAVKKVRMSATEAARALLARLGYDPQNGARPLDRVIREKIKRPLAEEVLFGHLENGGDLVIDAEDEAIVFRFPEN